MRDINIGSSYLTRDTLTQICKNFKTEIEHSNDLFVAVKGYEDEQKKSIGSVFTESQVHYKGINFDKMEFKSEPVKSIIFKPICQIFFHYHLFDLNKTYKTEREEKEEEF